jgi:hypothetical protein
MIRILFISLIAILGCRDDNVTNPETGELKILFIGNSLTYANDLPLIVEELGRQSNHKINSTSIVVGGYSLEDHWNDNTALSEIQRGKFDFVILQQGPSALPESQLLLLTYAQKFAEVCSAVNARPILYMVWPSSDRGFDLDNVIFSYTNAAAKTSSGIAPAGLAWKHAWESKPNLPLYSVDNFHPSFMGSLLAAMTVYGAITGEVDFSFINTNSTSMWNSQISKSDLELLKAAANKALTK